MTYARLQRGLVLRPSARVEVQFRQGFAGLVQQMTREVTREVLAVFRNDEGTAFDEADDVYTRTARELGLLPPPVAPEAVAMDASLADTMARLIDRMTTRFSVLFDNAAAGLTNKMIDDTLINSETGLKRSLREVSKSITLQITPKLREIADASAAEGAALIKRVPAEYLPQVQGDVMRSITSGNGLADLVPALEKRNVKIKNWAENTARDQTRKAYNNINKVRMQEAGVKKYEWIHSGGSNKPREYHLARDPSGLNGRICSLDDPPIIDENTGERGIPGQLPFCGCTMRPVIDLSDEED